MDYHAIDRIERIKSTGDDRLIAYRDDQMKNPLLRQKL